MAERFDTVEQWARTRSGTRFFRLAGSPAGPEVVVKITDSWAPEDAERMFEAMMDLADTIDAMEIAGAAAVRPLAWADAPPMVVMPYVEGTDLVSILRQPDHAAWTNLPEWMERAGGMLAAYHARHAATESAAAAGSEVRALAKRFRVGRTFDNVDWNGRIAGSYGDYGPGNLHVASDGNLYLFDPPVAPDPAPVHRDLANFVFELRRQLAGRGFTPSPPVPGHFDGLRHTFLQGYSETQGSPLDANDQSLIALFELRRAAGMARKRFPRRPSDAAWFARSVLARRREVLRAVSST